ncbi:replication initiator protein A [Streptobacillus moniliformis]|uniref:replication initiator protein A n=1 Tax=Streptobacillus moniliformis TaxID=34105 RepID=UPI0007E2EC2C|nr:replication initiator protein A [Streptobacillus moniliformis]
MYSNFNVLDISYQNFLTIPRDLIYNEKFKKLSLEAKLMYGLLMDRLKVSIKYNWIDSNGDVYLIYSINEIMQLLSISKPTAVKILKELEKFKMIEKKQQGLQKPNLLYLKKIDFLVSEKM